MQVAGADAAIASERVGDIVAAGCNGFAAGHIEDKRDTFTMVGLAVYVDRNAFGGQGWLIFIVFLSFEIKNPM